MPLSRIVSGDISSELPGKNKGSTFTFTCWMHMALHTVSGVGWLAGWLVGYLLVPQSLLTTA